MLRRIIVRGWRQFILLGAMFAFSGAIVQHLVYWQVVEHAAAVTADARNHYAQVTIIPAPRGGILDSAGLALVTNVPATDIAVDPIALGNALGSSAKVRKLARTVASILNLPVQTVQDDLTPRGNLEYVVLARQVPDGPAGQIRQLDLKLHSFILTNVWHRAYPQSSPADPSLAAPLLGFVNRQGSGQYGLEQQYQTTLQGRDGATLPVVYNASSEPLPDGIQPPHPAIQGATLQLTIDSNIQRVVEKRLLYAVQTYQAQYGTAIVMDPHTGAILAMASLPAFDPANYAATSRSDPGLFVNKALQNYQPGSTFKILSIAAGLDHRDFTPQTQVNDPGYYKSDKYPGITVYNWLKGSGWGWETPEIMLRHSANVGMVQFADMEGPKTFYDYIINHFGMGSQTGIDLPDEGAGLVRSPFNGSYWQMQDLLTNSYGQGIDITPLQLIDAVAALANHGVRMRPYLVQRIINPDSTTRSTTQPHPLGQAIGDATAATLTSILQRSAVDGEAICALTPEEPVAAKTGTATIDGPSAHGWSLTDGTVASLIGYAPADNPRFVMLVTLYHPQPGPNNNHIWGSETAAPVWHDIAQALYRALNIPKETDSNITPAKLANDQGPNGPFGQCEFNPGQAQ